MKASSEPAQVKDLWDLGDILALCVPQAPRLLLPWSGPTHQTGTSEITDPSPEFIPNTWCLSQVAVYPCYHAGLSEPCLQGGHTCSDRCNGQGEGWADLKAIVLQDEVLVHGDGHFDPAGGLGCAVPGTVHHRHTAPVGSEKTIKHDITRDSLSKDLRSTQFPALKGLWHFWGALQPAVTPWALQEVEDIRLVVTTTSQSSQPSGHTEGEAQECPTTSHDLHPQEPAAPLPSEAA